MKTVFYSFPLLVSASLGLAADKAREAEMDDIREADFVGLPLDSGDVGRPFLFIPETAPQRGCAHR